MDSSTRMAERGLSPPGGDSGTLGKLLSADGGESATAATVEAPRVVAANGGDMRTECDNVRAPHHQRRHRRRQQVRSYYSSGSTTTATTTTKTTKTTSRKLEKEAQLQQRTAESKQASPEFRTAAICDRQVLSSSSVYSPLTRVQKFIPLDYRSGDARSPTTVSLATNTSDYYSSSSQNSPLIQVRLRSQISATAATTTTQIYENPIHETVQQQQQQDDATRMPMINSASVVAPAAGAGETGDCRR